MNEIDKLFQNSITEKKSEEVIKGNNKKSLTRIQKNALVALSSIAASFAGIPIFVGIAVVLKLAIMAVALGAICGGGGPATMEIVIFLLVLEGVAMLASVPIALTNIAIFYVAHKIINYFKNKKTKEEMEKIEIGKLNENEKKEPEKVKKALSKAYYKPELISKERQKELKTVLKIVAISACIGAIFCAVTFLPTLIMSTIAMTMVVDGIFKVWVIAVLLGGSFIVASSIGVTTNLLAFNIIPAINNSIQKKKLAKLISDKQ